MYLGNRKFEKGKEKLFKINKAELEKKFGFYKDIDPTGVKGISFKMEFSKKVGLEDRYNANHLSDGIFKYELMEQGILETYKEDGNEYRSFYNATEKKFE